MVLTFSSAVRKTTIIMSSKRHAFYQRYHQIDPAMIVRLQKIKITVRIYVSVENGQHARVN